MGVIPKHWELKKLKHVFQEKKKVTNPELPCGSISYGKVVYKDDEKIPESTKASYQEVLAGEFLINPLNLNYDLVSLRIGLSQINVVVSSGYIVLKNVIELDKSYFYYLLHRYDVAYMKLLGSGVRQTISFNHISNSLLAFPPLPEQTTIAAFLDDKTAKIDRAIAQKEKMIALLKERKQIIIQNAVTKGLDPNAKMKDSGVEWIREIPEGWEVKRLRNVFSFSKGLTITKENLQDEGIPCINYGEIHSKYGFEVNPEVHPLKCVNEEYLKDNSNSLLKKGDFIFGDTSEDLEGSGNFTYLNFEGTVFAGYHTIIARPKSSINSRFLAYTLHSLPFRNQVRTRMKGVKVFSITQSILKDLSCWYPNEKEQKTIAEYLDTESAKIDKAVKMQDKQIEKLKELKSTLIDSAVTGKIKVC
ncbi:MAG: restriction endonuclease subunit S [Bacteroidetes bacterium]|nr:restriction endonuclease subunit S [Bacteroidota bacterium]